MGRTSTYLALVCLLLFAASCKEASNPCRDVICVQGGCVEGACLCNEGFEGPDCSEEMRSKFVRKWEGGDICLSGSSLYEVEVMAGTGIRDIRIANIFQTGDTVLAVVSGLVLTFEIQAFGQWTIEGSGQIDTTANPVTLSLDYEIDQGGGSYENCLLTLQPSN